MNDLIDTTEMYLRIIFELEEEGIVPLRARIAERLNQSGPTVSQTVARMERDGLLVLSGDRHLQLTDMGRQRATSVMRKHRLAERLLLDVIGLDWAEVHVEACRWEHVMSREVEQRIAAQIAPPYLDPYGNPIPGLAELGIDETAVTSAGNEGKNDAIGMRELAEAVPEGTTASLELVRIGERAQSDPGLLEELAGHGIIPGSTVSVDRVADSFVLQGPSGGTVTVPLVIAGQLHVTPIVGG